MIDIILFINKIFRLNVAKITYLFIHVTQLGWNTFCREYYIAKASLDLVGSQSIPRYAWVAFGGPNKVLGSLGNVMFPALFILHPNCIPVMKR